MGKTVTSVSLPEQVLAETEKAAKELRKSRSEIVKDALIGYLRDLEWKKIQEETRRYATVQGILSETDVENVIREIRTTRSGKH